MNEIVTVYLAATKPQQAGSIQEILRLIAEASPIVKGVIALLLLFLVLVVFIYFYKLIQLTRAKHQTKKFLQTFWNSKRLDEIYQAADLYERSPVSKLFKSGYIELSKLKSASEKKSGEKKSSEGDEISIGGSANVERALQRSMTEEITYLESMVPTLATIASTAPFVGLFGTVVGIMISFMQINATGGAGMEVVSQGISEALIATAIGLLAAIPAVMAYNFFLRQIRVLTSKMENFSADFQNIVKRHF